MDFQSGDKGGVRAERKGVIRHWTLSPEGDDTPFSHSDPNPSYFPVKVGTPTGGVILTLTTVIGVVIITLSPSDP